MLHVLYLRLWEGNEEGGLMSVMCSLLGGRIPCIVGGYHWQPYYTRVYGPPPAPGWTTVSSSPAPARCHRHGGVGVQADSP